ncbi:hypothetical protein NQ318_019129 [Aromia moschata]|uniref:Cytochrome P450 n=1 Tax=Aromia moschata TaxID=1265417 RepID=A0AAV8YQG0_9CUCU|nr:hypothetical protein NQ318_019129 [Aromia moschata]
MALLLGLALAALLFYYLMKKHFNYWKKQGVKQEKSLWILGDTWRNSFRLENPVDLIQRIYNYCPSARYFGIYQFFMPTLVLRDPDIIKTVTVKDFNHFENHRNFVPEDIDPLWGKNLLVLQGKNGTIPEHY